MAHVYNPSTLGGQGVDHEIRSSKPTWPTWRNLSLLKNSWAWWQAPVISATQEAEAGDLLEPWK